MVMCYVHCNSLYLITLLNTISTGTIFYSTQIVSMTVYLNTAEAELVFSKLLHYELVSFLFCESVTSTCYLLYGLSISCEKYSRFFTHKRLGHRSTIYPFRWQISNHVRRRI